MGAAPPPDRSPEGVRRAAEEILAGPGFESDDPPVLERVLSWIGERLSDLFGGGAGDPAVGAGGGTRGSLVGLILLAAALIGLGLVLWRATRGLSSRRSGPAGPVVVEEATASGDEWRRRASAARQAGDLREATRCLYRALVVELADEGVIHEIPGRTSGDHRRDVGLRAPGRLPAFAAAAATFDDVYYGGRPASDEDLDRMVVAP